MKPKEIEINNLFKYGTTDNIFNFDKSSLSLIIGPNGSGKSSIFESVSFALFEQTIRWGLTKKEVLRRGAKYGFARLVFNHADKDYEVRRRRDADGSGSVSFTCLDTGESLTGNLRETNEEIIKVIGFDFNAFRNSVLFGQHDLTKVISLRSGDRLELLSNFLGLNVLDNCFDIARIRSSNIAGELKGIESELEFKNKSDVKRKLKTMLEVEKEYIETIKEVQIKQGDLSELVNKLERLDAGFSNARITIKTSREEMLSLVEQKRSLESAIINNTDVQTLEKEFKSSQIAKERLEEIESELLDLREEERQLNNSYIIWKNKVRESRDNISQIRRKNHCVSCDRPIDDQTKENLINKIKKGLEESNNKTKGERDKLKDIIKKISSLTKELNSLKEVQDPDVIYEKIVQARTSEKITAEINNIESMIRKKNLIIEQKKRMVESIKEEGYSEERLERLKQGLMKTKGKLSETETELKNVQELIKQLRQSLNEISSLEKVLEELSVKSKKAEFILDLFSKTGGLRQIIIENVLPVLNSKVNRYLDLLSEEGISVEFTTGLKTKSGKYKNKLDIIIVSPEGVADFASYSGGEKQTIILAMGLGISELAAESVGMECEILLLDEVFSSLDGNARKRLVALLYELQKKFKNIIAISHIKELRNQLPNVVSIQRRGRLSKIIQ